MNTLLTLARKELKDGLRNRWVLAIAILLAAFALTLAFLGSAPAGETKAAQYLSDSADCAAAFV